MVNGRKADEQLVADEVVVGIRSRRGRVLDTQEAHAVHLGQTIDQDLREGAFARPARCINLEWHDEWPSARPGPDSSARG